MKDFFAAQGVNPLLDLKLDDWLGVAHVDEVVQLAPSGKKVLIADPDVAWALALWAAKLDPNVRMHPKMNGNESLPGYTSDGMKLERSSSPTRRSASRTSQFAQHSTRLRGVVRHGQERDGADRRGVRARQVGQRDRHRRAAARRRVHAHARQRQARVRGEVPRRRPLPAPVPRRRAARTRSGSTAASRATRSSPRRRRSCSSTTGAAPPRRATGSRSRPTRPRRWSRCRCCSRPAGCSCPTSRRPSSRGGSAPFSTNHINSIVDGQTVVAGKAYGPQVNLDGSGQERPVRGLRRAPRSAPPASRKIVFADARLYHDASGSLHCGTNAIRVAPAAKWWEA